MVIINIHEAIVHLKAGKSVTRACWSTCWYVKLGCFDELDFYMRSNDKIIDDVNLWFVDDIEANDWEVIE